MCLFLDNLTRKELEQLPKMISMNEKICFSCKNSKVAEIVKDNKKAYYCPACKKINTRFIDQSREIFSEETKEGTKHITVSAIVEKNGKILLIKRRVWPYLYDLPAGHLNKGETPEQGIKRELLEETGLICKKSELIYHKEHKDDPCRHGAEIHEWYLFKVRVVNFETFNNSEGQSLEWFSKKEALKLNFPVTTQYLVSNIVFEKQNIISLDTKKGTEKNELLLPDSEKQTELLYHISQALFKLSDTEGILNAGLRETLNALSINSAIICVKDPFEGDREIYQSRNKDSFLKEEAAKKIFSRVIAKNESVSKTEVNSKNSGSLLALPIQSGGQTCGVIAVYDQSERYFTEGESQFLTILSGQIGLAIENGKLYGKLNRKIANLSKLFGITSIVNRQTEATIQNIIDTVPDLFECEKTALLLLNEKKDHLKTFLCSKNSSFAQKLGVIPVKSISLANLSCQSKKPFYSNDPRNDSRVDQDLANKFKATSILSVPVLAKNQCLGALVILNKHNNKFEDEDAKLASIVATRIGMKIENSQLQSRTEIERDLLNSVMENTNEGIAVLDNAGKIILVNRALEELSGISLKKIRGKFAASALRILGLNEFSSGVANLFLHPELNNNSYSERELPFPLGQRNWFGINFNYIFNQKNEIDYIVVRARNITREKELLKAKNELISTATHELRTPLTAVKGYLSMALNGDAGKLSEKMKKYLTEASKSTERLVVLVEDLLSTLRISENKVELNSQNFELSQIIKEAVSNLKNKGKDKGIKINFGQSSMIHAFGDPLRSKQIIENLLDNAIKYTEEKGLVKIVIRNNPESVIVSVKDNGVGIAQQDCQKIFDRFTRINNPLSIKAGGTGLGLFIAKNLVERQGGKIWVESKPDKGSTFHFTIPAPINLKNNN